MTLRRLALVVEGHGEVDAAPVLIRRVGAVLAIPTVPDTPKPVRVPKSKLLKADELERAVKLAALKAGACGAVLVLLDADEDCPATLGPELLGRATAAVGGGVPISVVLAKWEFECWFIAAAESLRGKRGLRDDLMRPEAPEAVQGAKEWLDRHMADPDVPYSATLDQPALASEMDLNAAGIADSFDKFWRETERLLEYLRTCA